MPVPVDLSKLANVVNNDVVKKDVEDKIPAITNLATNTSLKGKMNGVKGEIPNVPELAVNSSLNAKINEVKDEIANFTNLTTTTTLTAVENKILSLSYWSYHGSVSIYYYSRI